MPRVAVRMSLLPAAARKRWRHNFFSSVYFFIFLFFLLFFSPSLLLPFVFYIFHPRSHARPRRHLDHGDRCVKYIETKAGTCSSIGDTGGWGLGESVLKVDL